MSPSDRGEMLTKAENFINAHKEIAVEGQTAVIIIVNYFLKALKIVLMLFIIYNCYTIQLEITEQIECIIVSTKITQKNNIFKKN